MARRSDFVEFVAGQMAFVGELRIRAMFGGYGIYQDDCMFALIADDRLYFKADATTLAECEAKGLSPFTYVARGKPVTLQYFREVWIADAPGHMIRFNGSRLLGPC